MKKYFKFFTVAAIVAAGLVGCSSEVVDDGNTPGSKPGELTAATFSFPDLKATKGAALSDAVENTPIASLRLLVYNWNAAQTGECQVDTVVMSANPTATVLVTSGDKTILVLANDHTAAPSGPITDLTSKFKIPSQKGKALAELYKTVKTYNNGNTYLNEFVLGTPAMNAAPGGLASLDYSSIAGPTSLFYSNSVADSSSKKSLVGNISPTESQTGDSTKNHFIIYVKRSVAKISAYTSATVASSAITTKDGKGTIAASATSPVYGFRNQNRGVAIFQVPTSSSKPQAPFYEVTTSSGFTLTNIDHYKPYWWSSGPAAELSGVLTSGLSGAPSNPVYYYVPENANAQTLRGNTTYLAIEATYKPNDGTVITAFNADGSLGGVLTSPGSVTLGNIATPTFYRVKSKTTAGAANIATYGKGIISDGAVFSTMALANKFYQVVTAAGYPDGAASTPAQENADIVVEEYTTGKCYYRLNVGNTGEVFVARNNRYLINIRSFNTLGAPKLGDLDKDPQLPIEEPTYVTATVSITPWAQINQDGDV